MTSRFYPVLVLLMISTISAGRPATAADNPKPTAEDLAFFESRIRPLLIKHCVECHGEDAQESDLRLDTWAGLRDGGKAGPVILPGKPDQSLLLVAVSYRDNELRMPPDGKLSAVEQADLKRWIEIGAPHPDRTESDSPQPRRGTAINYDEARKFWAFLPTARPAVPTDVTGRAKSDVDRFVLAKLSAAGLTLSEPADRRALLRRVSLDLTGLPPTPDEIQAFLQDESPNAFATVVDRLLNSPHYGERWGRHWLDVARYADSNGLDENIAHGNAWRYRDYVVASFNADKPWDRFLTEQIAGDLLPVDESQAGWRERRNEQLIATGFLALGPKVLAEVDEMKMEMDIIDEQLDTLGKAVLGLTLGCARCHDHKFDPVSMSDYYGLAGMFKSTRVMEHFKKIAKWNENPVPTDADLERKAAHDQQVAAVKVDVERLVAEAKARFLEGRPEGTTVPADFEKQLPDESKKELTAARDRLKALEKETENLVPTAMGANEGTVSDLAIHLRGSHLTLGDVVPRRIPELFADRDPPAIPVKQSGRRELAQWLTRRDNPLTARVLVNRVWRWHFGQGLVNSPDNFGLLGDRPTHPELLDWLAIEFMDNGWSLKHLHRTMLLSAVYQQSSRLPDGPSPTDTIDPDNRLYWRFPLQRMEAEVLRDSLLAVSGLLDRSMGGSMLHVKNREFFFDHTSKDTTKYDSRRRSLYLPVVRNNLYDVFELFDHADPSVSNGSRSSSTVAPQTLFLMNSELIQDAATALAARVLEAEGLTERQRLDRLSETVTGYPATDAEAARMQEFLKQSGAVPVSASGNVASEDIEKRRAAWTRLSHVLLASNAFLYVR